MILRELREIDQATDDILIYGNDGTTNKKIKTDSSGRPDIVSDKLDVNLSTRSSDSTSKEIRDTLGQESGATVLSRLSNVVSKLKELFDNGIALTKIWDGTNIAGITDAGRIKIDSSPPDAPPATTPVVITELSNVSGSDDNTFLIPSGDTLVIQRFSAGAEADTTAGNAIQLFHDPDGDGGANMAIIDVIFASGNGDQHDLRSTFVGDGTALIRMRRLRFSGGSKLIFGRWEGYH